MIGSFKIGTDIVLVETLYDENGDEILISGLNGYGIELYAGNNLVGKYGVNLTGFTDSYIEASGTSELTFNFPSSILTKSGDYFGILYLNYTDLSFADGYRDLYSNKVILFNLFQ